MHSQSLQDWQHRHDFLGAAHDKHERQTWIVVALTSAMMVAEIIAGSVYGSMALLADGWHMSTHAAALTITALAYRLARKHVGDARFSFGTGKVGELAGFASALILALIALLIGYESAIRLFNPVSIRFDEAMLVAVIGLAVNLLSAWLLSAGGGHDHAYHGRHDDHHGHDDDHDHHHDAHAHDSNISAAFAHVAADALTSVLAILALLGGRFYGWIWLDAVIGIVGALVIMRWSYGLIMSSAATLLDTVPDRKVASDIVRSLEVDGDKVGDLHLWRLGPGHAGVIASVISHDPQAPDVYKARLASIHGLSHMTIEVHRCSPAPTDKAPVSGC